MDMFENTIVTNSETTRTKFIIGAKRPRNDGEVVNDSVYLTNKEAIELKIKIVRYEILLKERDQMLNIAIADQARLINDIHLLNKAKKEVIVIQLGTIEDVRYSLERVLDKGRFEHHVFQRMLKDCFEYIRDSDIEDDQGYDTRQWVNGHPILDDHVERWYEENRADYAEIDDAM